LSKFGKEDAFSVRVASRAQLAAAISGRSEVLSGATSGEFAAETPGLIMSCGILMGLDVFTVLTYLTY
jgi:hypothetical protein